MTNIKQVINHTFAKLLASFSQIYTSRFPKCVIKKIIEITQLFYIGVKILCYRETVKVSLIHGISSKVSSGRCISKYQLFKLVTFILIVQTGSNIQSHWSICLCYLWHVKKLYRKREIFARQKFSRCS